MLGAGMSGRLRQALAELAGVTVAPPLPNPPWVRWDHTGSRGVAGDRLPR
jgi:hypothetical protein